MPTSGKILNFGCGRGILSIELARKGYEVTGIDGSKGMIDAVENQLLRFGLSNVSFEVLDSESFRFIPESYDAVVCSSVLEYVEDDKNAAL